jgi:hypothetical protein
MFPAGVRLYCLLVGTCVLLATGSAFSAPPLLTLDPLKSEIWLDLDSDSEPDRVSLRQGAGIYRLDIHLRKESKRISFLFPSNPNRPHIALHDLDRDGDYDVVVARPNHPLCLLLNEGAGRFRETQEAPLGWFLSPRPSYEQFGSPVLPVLALRNERGAWSPSGEAIWAIHLQSQERICATPRALACTAPHFPIPSRSPPLFSTSS